MPMYDYSCPNCGLVFEEYYPMSEDSSSTKCSCGALASKRYTPCALKTDTSFCLTGKHHMSLCDDKDDLIEGRSDFDRRLEDRNLRVLDKAELKPKKRSFN